jgi:hypothetical protein
MLNVLLRNIYLNLKYIPVEKDITVISNLTKCYKTNIFDLNGTIAI